MPQYPDTTQAKRHILSDKRLFYLEKAEQWEEGEDIPPRGVDLGPRGVLSRHGAVHAGVAQERRIRGSGAHDEISQTSNWTEAATITLDDDDFEHSANRMLGLCTGMVKTKE